MAQNSWLIRGARQLVTLRGPAPRRGRQLSELEVIPDGAVLIRGDRILEVGSSRRLDNLKQVRGAEVYEADGKVVMPGFVDSHTHFVFPAPRPADFGQRYSKAAALEPGTGVGGVYSTIHVLRETSPRVLELRALNWLRHLAACGTTTVEGKSGFGLTTAAELKMLRVMQKVNGRPISVVPTFLGAHFPPPEFQLFADEYLNLVIEDMLPIVRRRRLAEFVDVFCDASGFTLQQTRRVLGAAQALGFDLKLHADRSTRNGAAALGIELGAVSVDHLDRINDYDLDRLAAAPTIATLLPGVVFHLASGPYPPARRLIERGAAVALATGFHPWESPTLNLQMILSLACSQMRMTPAEALAAATVNGACALGRSAEIGSLEPGKFADLLVLDVGDYRDIAYYFGMNLCLRTMRHGEWISPAPVEDPFA